MNPKFDFNEHLSEQLERTYQIPDMNLRRNEVLRLLDLRTGEAVLDVGLGPGFVSYLAAAAVGPSGRIEGIDTSDVMLELARARCADKFWVTFQNADATALPFEDASFDAVIVTQVLEYVEEIDTALSELHRVLKPGGRALLLDIDWESIVWHTEDAGRMTRVLKTWDEHLHDPILPRTLPHRLQDAGMPVERRSILPLYHTAHDANTYSYALIQLIRDFCPGRNGLTQAEVEDWAAEQERLGDRGAYFFSLNQYFFLARKP
ncbi:MAG: methyltransferase domain-containing protein [Candidatus Hydrogenedentes bacterium]|nr:methyltransferase domain-containing protein [Candidatus Hydrogenedentota bacterium]